MTSLGWITMVVICGFVWGGFGWFITWAIGAERRKSRGDGSSS